MAKTRAPVRQLLSRAQKAHEAGNLAQAEKLYRTVLIAQPDHAEALYSLCIIKYQRRRYSEALALVERLLAINPALPEAHYSRGTILQALGQPPQALESYDEALRLRPQYLEALHNRAVTLYFLKRYDEALECSGKALAFAPGFAEAHFVRGYVFFETGRFGDALASYESLLALNPDHALGHNNRGMALQQLGRYREALASYDRALGLGFVDADLNRGNVLRELGDPAGAMASYGKALAAQPQNALAHLNRGILLQDHGRVGEAIASLQRAVGLDPSLAQPHALLVYLKQQACDWSRSEIETAWLLNAVRKDAAGITPFMLLSQPSLPADHLQCSRQWAKAYSGPVKRVFSHASPGERGKIRLCYLGADFRDHPVGFLLPELFERHDRRQFDVVVASYGPDDGGATRRRIQGAVDRFVELRSTSFGEAARRIDADGVGILVDVAGYTMNARVPIVAARPAPIQVSFLGYPATMGADFIDYIIVDSHLVPTNQQRFFTEKLVQLPHCYQPSDRRRPLAAQTPSRADCGLPPTGFVFCCFNASHKITPAFFDIWMRLLQRVPRSVLWLFDANPLASDNLRRAAAARRIPSERLVFAPRLPLAEYLARYRLADLFLDTSPYNAGATANDALWAGLPVLTCTGETYVGRMAGSMLQAVGLPELVTASPTEYEALASRLATQPGLLAELRAKLMNNRSTMPLFDMSRYVRDLETAFSQMWELWCAGKPPSPISLNSAG